MLCSYALVALIVINVNIKRVLTREGSSSFFFFYFVAQQEFVIPGLDYVRFYVYVVCNGLYGNNRDIEYVIRKYV